MKAPRSHVIARSVGAHDEGDEVLQDVAVIDQRLLGVLGQTVAAVVERGVVAVRADPQLQAHIPDVPEVKNPLDSPRPPWAKDERGETGHAVCVLSRPPAVAHRHR